jgi:uncharacterized protein
MWSELISSGSVHTRSEMKNWQHFLAAIVLAIVSAIVFGPKSIDMVHAWRSDFARREVMIPMRDGVKLHTVIVYRKNASDSPILLSRTPYGTSAATVGFRRRKIQEIFWTSMKRWPGCCADGGIAAAYLPIVADAEFADAGYIRVYQDIRGRHGSEGEFTLFKPLTASENCPAVDDSTDAYDTIAWLVENLPQSNGAVGMVGSSYLGSAGLMALVDPHPALRAVVAQSPMVDGWMGDDWFHNGAFRNYSLGYIEYMQGEKSGGDLSSKARDDYAAYLAAGSAADLARRRGIAGLATTRDVLAHPAYDAFWRTQAIDKLLASRELTIPLMLVVGQWDEEDSYGASAVYRALHGKSANGAEVHLVVGPWSHSQENGDGSMLGPLRFARDTAREFRSGWLRSFLDCRLKTDPPPCSTPPVLSYATGADRWEASDRWPHEAHTPLYLTQDFALSFSRPGVDGSDEYVSDPLRPAPMTQAPIEIRGAGWSTWLVQDQRFLHGRPDMLAYKSAPLTEPLHIKGAPRAELHAATSGRDADWVLKLIDVYPDPHPGDPGMAGYELPVGIEIFRGRYVHGFSNPEPLEPGKTYRFEWSLPNVDHVFMPGHRLMVQVQSSLFPLYDRNPQSWVPSIFDAKPDDYVKATMTIRRGGENASVVWLPVVK